MRMVVMSDSHNEKDLLKQIITKHRNDASLFVFLGDGLDEFEDITMFDSKIKSIKVKGNCDFDSNADSYEVFTFAKKKVFAAHGDLYGVKEDLQKIKNTALEKGADICLYGHTHIQHHEKDGSLIVINPGAVMDSGKYCVIDIVNDETEIKFFSSDGEFDTDFIPPLEYEECDDRDILQPLSLEEEQDLVQTIKIKSSPMVPCYVKNRFNKRPTKVDRYITAPIPEFVANHDGFQREVSHGNHNYKIFQAYMLDFIKEKFRRESKSIEDSMSMPYVALRLIFLNNNIQRSTFTNKTFLSDATYDRIMKNNNYVPDLKTLTNICWTFKIDYLTAEALFRSYGINLDAKTMRIRAYKHVLKYMMFLDLDTINRFLDENKVPHFQKIPQ